ncbi:MAG: PD-(D/E)XK nuclease family protein [Dehalococcoidia bacterium]
MPVKRHFLGWEAPLTEKVCEFLLPSEQRGPVDLDKYLIVVPTRQSGRRLRETLAIKCSARKTALLSPRVVTPAYFFQPDPAITVANPIEVIAAWAGLLLEIDLRQYPGLFPTHQPHQDFSWATHFAGTIESLRDELADGGYSLSDIISKSGSELEEPERWHDLARLESAYLESLERNGRMDPVRHKIEQSRNPRLGGSIERIITASVSDPSQLMITALEILSPHIPIEILIHAPEYLADQFDEWGRPVVEKWRRTPIEVPDPASNIILAGSPASQSQKALEQIYLERERFGPGDIAIGIPDSTAGSYLQADLEDSGLPSFNPAGKTQREHPLYRLLEAFNALINEGTYHAFSRLIRHSDILAFLDQQYSLPTIRILTELDLFQNQHLPMDFHDITLQLSQPDQKESFPALAEAFSFIRRHIEGFLKGELDSALRSFLRSVYQGRTLNPGSREDHEFTMVAESLNTALEELRRCSLNFTGIENRHAPGLLLYRLKGERYYPERQSAGVDLEDWLELPWNDAPFLVVTGMNEGTIPKSRQSDIFLPDSLKKQLGLRHDEVRLATDAFMMRQMIESRRGEGRACFISGKTGATGDPLKPSRLLLRCSDEELPERAGHLFKEPAESRDNHPATITFKLNPTPPPDTTHRQEGPEKLHVTSFRDYLACPFRFYLKHVLGMERLDDRKGELDPADFGALIHETLHRMAQNDRVRDCENETELARFLRSEAENLIHARFGKSPPLQVEVQLHSATQRLAAVAHVHARMAQEGWRVIGFEKRITARLNGTAVTGRIDRIDRHESTGRIRILDYKTSETVNAPEKLHLAPDSADTPDFARISVNGKERRWIDLQLPLYLILLPHIMQAPDSIQLGYFHIPRATTDTGISIWDGFSDDLFQSAKSCAEGIVECVRNRIFWPPASRIANDEFGHLFHGEPAECIDQDSFIEFMEQNK